MNTFVNALLAACCFWVLTFFFARTAFSSLAEVYFTDKKGGTPLVAFCFPILLASAASSLLFIRRNDERRHKVPPIAVSIANGNISAPHQIPRRLRVVIHSANFLWRSFHSTIARFSDSNVLTMVSLLGIVLPTVYLTLSTLAQKLSQLEGASHSTKVKQVANVFGMSSIICLSVYLLIPVARHGVLTSPRWNYAATIVWHVWAGRLVLITGFLHSILHSYNLLVVQKKGWSIMFPPKQCWHTARKDGSHCHTSMISFTGLLTSLAFLVIAVTTLNSVRRNMYHVFYLSHVFAAPLSILLLTAHYRRAMVYMSGALIYYLTSSIPVFLYNWLLLQRDGGTKILSVERLSCSDSPTHCFCTSVTFAATDIAAARYRAGQYVRLFCPTVSFVAHPFTINTVPGHPEQLRIIYRATGKFTQQLTHALTHQPPCLPRIGLDGFHGSPKKLQQATSHDRVLIVAGGIGITPYLSLLHQLVSQQLNFNADTVSFTSTPLLLELHWSCRDWELVRYVRGHYFDSLLADASFASKDLSTRDDHVMPLQIKIIVHFTGQRPIHPTEDGGTHSHLIIDTSQGLPFSPSPFAAGTKDSYHANIPKAAGLVVTYIFCIVWVWYYYSQHTTKHQIWSRVWSPMGVIFLSSLSAVVLSSLYRLGVVRDYHGLHRANWDPVAVEMSERRADCEQMVSSPSKPPSLHLGERPAMVSYEERFSGRPNLCYLVATVLDPGAFPGAFVCGPDVMIRQLRRTLGYHEARIPSLCSTGKRATLYEESFHM